MSRHRLTNALCVLLSAAMLILTVCFMNGEALGISLSKSSAKMGYESLFDDTVMHTIDIVADGSAWETMLENAQAEEYIACSVVIDGEAVKNAAVRPKGNTSLSQVTTDRYSLKIEFDHYQSGGSYKGLDKLVLNNLIQDDTYMKDWLCYTLFRQLGAAAPLCSFAVVTVNGEYYGLCLALEAVEESFLLRNYGHVNGDLYKPDSALGGDGSANLCYTGDAVSNYGDIFDSAKTAVTAEEQAELIAALKALSQGDAESSVDTDALLRYFVVHNFVVNGDSYTGSMIHNYYLYQDNGILTMLPWDYNLAFGAFSMGGGAGGNSAVSAINQPLDDPLLSGSMSTRPMLAWIFESEEYLEQYHLLMDEFLAKCFESGWFSERIAQMTALLSPYVQEDATSFTDYDSFREAAQTLQQFCTLRAESLRGQLEGTIPSTSTAQAADSSSLIQGETLSISAMGSMGGGRGNTMGGGMGGRNNARDDSDDTQEDQTSPSAPPTDDTRSDLNMPQWGDQFPGEDSSQELTPPDGSNFPGDMELPQNFQAANKDQFRQDLTDRGGMASGGFTAATSLATIVLLGASLLVLLAALLFAWRYKRK